MKKTKDKISDVKIKKKFEKIREDKCNEMRDFFEKKLNYYNQSNDKYGNVIDNSIDLYMEEINKLVIIYNKLFDNISKFIEEENCKKFEINDDLLKLNDKLKNDLNNELERIKILKMIDACTKKAINHDVLIEEFKEMQNKYFEELENVFNEIFKINFYQIVIFDDSFLGKFKRNFVAIFLGRRKFERFLKEYNDFMLKDFEEKNDKKIKKLKKEINKVTELIEIKKQEVQNEYYRMIA